MNYGCPNFRDQAVDLSSLALNLYHILNNLKRQLNICKQQIGQLLKKQCFLACVESSMQCHEKGLNADERFCLNVEETETVAYQMLTNLFQIRPKIDEVFKALCYGKSNVLQLIDGSNEVCSDYPSLWLLLLSSVQCYLLLFQYTYSTELFMWLTECL
jgi:hypothetical protein